MKIYAYIRQNEKFSVSEQLKQLIPFKCDEFFLEEQLDNKRSELEKLQNKVVERDRVLITDITVFGFDGNEFIEMMAEFLTRGVEVVSVSDSFDSTKLVSTESLLLLLAAMDQSHSLLASDKLTSHRNRRGELGRPSLNSKTINRIRYLYRSHSLSMREIAEECNVSLGTVHKYINE